MYVACCLYVCMCVCVAVYVCMLLVLCKQVCWRRAPHLDKASLFPACALFANTNPAPLEGHPRVKIKPRHTPSHWSASQQTFPREWSWSLRLRIHAGIRRCARDVRTWSAAKNHPDEQRGSRRDPGVRQPGAGRGQLPARSKSAIFGCLSIIIQSQ